LIRYNSRMKRNSLNGGLVYSTETGRMCPGCRSPINSCICKQANVLPKADGVVRVSRNTKGRGGKTVTLVKGLALDEVALVQLGKQLRSACGTGGTVKDGVIEVQGDHTAQVMLALQKLAYVVKQTGA